MSKSRQDIKVEEMQLQGYFIKGINVNTINDKKIRTVTMQNANGDRIHLDHYGKIII